MALSKRLQFSGEKGICHMPEATITPLRDPSGFASDPLTELVRNGARKLIEQAIYKKADEEARRHGTDRRSFLASTAGMMASLSVINTISAISR